MIGTAGESERAMRSRRLESAGGRLAEGWKWRLLRRQFATVQKAKAPRARVQAVPASQRVRSIEGREEGGGGGGAQRSVVGFGLKEGAAEFSFAGSWALASTLSTAGKIGSIAMQMKESVQAKCLPEAGWKRWASQAVNSSTASAAMVQARPQERTRDAFIALPSEPARSTLRAAESAQGRAECDDVSSKR